MKNLVIAGKEFSSRLIMGTGKYSSNQVMEDAIKASGAQMVTAALKRIDTANEQDDMMAHIRNCNVVFLPNTSGARTAEEAILAAQLAKEALGTNWVKLEIHPDPKYLLPDPVETLKAAEELVKQGFVVLPYVQADPVLCKLLEEVGVATVMPLAAPIGSNMGIRNKDMLQIIINQSRVPVIVDAGIGRPSHASQAMEMGADAVMLNTAAAIAGNPVSMAKSFKLAIEAGRMAFEAKPADESFTAQASSPLTSFLD
ncbi:MAG: thiazole synthase [Lentimicrobiaceae bacterium]|nr:thiazole synthase [Lentimicrobiaceae bacterium]